jgi:hypothetical protein
LFAQPLLAQPFGRIKDRVALLAEDVLSGLFGQISLRQAVGGNAVLESQICNNTEYEIDAGSAPGGCNQWP